MLVVSTKISIESNTCKDSCTCEVKTIVDFTKMGEGIKEEGGKGGSVEGSEAGMTVEDCGGHSAETSTKLTSSVVLQGTCSLGPSDVGLFL